MDITTETICRGVSDASFVFPRSRMKQIFWEHQNFNSLHQKSGSLHVKSVWLQANDDDYQANEN